MYIWRKPFCKHSELYFTCRDHFFIYLDT